MNAIDSLCGLFTHESIERNFLNGEEGERLASVGRLAGIRSYSPKGFRHHLESLGVQQALIPSLYTKSYFADGPTERFDLQEVIHVTQAEPDAFGGLYGIDVRARTRGTKELELVVQNYGFKGAHIHPHGFGLRVDHAYYFPFYAKCEELGIPVILSMGNTLDYMPIEVANPLHLDTVALYFPGLRIVCAHTGWPWIREAIALATKHENMYIATSAHAPKYWDAELVQFLNSSRGRGKVMWGTDFPLISHSESLDQVAGLGLREESQRALLTDTAALVFGLNSR